MMRKAPEKLGDVLNSILADAGYLSICKEYAVVHQWPDIVGEQLAGVTECTRAEDGVLYVRVASAPWRQELAYLKKEILKKILRETDCATIKDIVFL